MSAPPFKFKCSAVYMCVLLAAVKVSAQGVYIPHTSCLRVSTHLAHTNQGHVVVL